MRELFPVFSSKGSTVAGLCPKNRGLVPQKVAHLPTSLCFFFLLLSLLSFIAPLNPLLCFYIVLTLVTLLSIIFLVIYLIYKYIFHIIIQLVMITNILFLIAPTNFSCTLLSPQIVFISQSFLEAHSFADTTEAILFTLIVQATNLSSLMIHVGQLFTKVHCTLNPECIHV